MIFLFLLTVINAVADQHNFILEQRVFIGPLPVNLIDVLMIVCVIRILFTNRSRAGYFVTDKPSGVFLVIIAGFTLAVVAGILMAFQNGIMNDFRRFVTVVRDFVAMPIGLIIGYFLIKQPRSSMGVVYSYIIGGVLVSAATFLFFGSHVSESQATANINLLRSGDFIDMYAGVVGPMLLFAVLAGIRLFSAPVTLGLALLCIIAELTTLTRSCWVAVTASVVAMIAMLPRGKRIRGASLVTVIVPLILVLAWAGVQVVSSATNSAFAAKVDLKVQSLMPSHDEGVWAGSSRLPGMVREVELWGTSPIIGRGFGIQEMDEADHPDVAYHHCPWADYLCETGMLGFGAMATMAISTIVIGARMIRDRTDRSTVIIGALGVSTAAYGIAIGICTMSINTMRGGLPLGVICGVVMRARAMQLTTKRIWRDYLPESHVTDGHLQPLLPDLEAAWAGASAY